jgi:hypothetical protein
MQSPVSGDLLLSLAALSIPAKSPFSMILSFVAIGFEQDRFDQRANSVHGASAALFALQRATEAPDLLVVWPVLPERQRFFVGTRDKRR